VMASTAGKLELEYAGEEQKTDDLVDRLIGRAVLAVWDRYLTMDAVARVIAHFEAGWGCEVSDRMPALDYRDGVQQIPGLREALEHLGPSESPGLTAAAIEFVLEGLHLHQKLNKDRDGGRWAFRA